MIRHFSDINKEDSRTVGLTGASICIVIASSSVDGYAATIIADRAIASVAVAHMEPTNIGQAMALG
jgi:hypothetical protein